MGLKMRTANLVIKRLIDFFGSLVGIIITLPIFILIALSIKFTSKGPVIFIQERIGMNGKVYNILKFRTMLKE